MVLLGVLQILKVTHIPCKRGGNVEEQNLHIPRQHQPERTLLAASFQSWAHLPHKGTAEIHTIYF